VTAGCFCSTAATFAAVSRSSCGRASLMRELVGYRVPSAFSSRTAVVRSSGWPNSQNASAASMPPCHNASSPYGLFAKMREMSSNERTSVRARSRSGVARATASRVSMSLRRADSRTSASWNSFAALDVCADKIAAVLRQIAAATKVLLKPDPTDFWKGRLKPAPTDDSRRKLEGDGTRRASSVGSGFSRTLRLPQLRIDFLEIAAIDEHLARLAAGARRHEPLGFHHVHEPRGAAEANPQLPLQIRDRRLSAAHDNTRGLVVELVLLELKALGTSLVVLGRDRLVEDR